MGLTTFDCFYLFILSIDDVKQIDALSKTDATEEAFDIITHTRVSRNLLKEGSNIHCLLEIAGTEYVKTKDITYSSKSYEEFILKFTHFSNNFCNC